MKLHKNAASFCFILIFVIFISADLNSGFHLIQSARADQDDLEELIENDLEEQIDNDIEAQLEDDLEEQMEEALEAQLEDDLETQIEDDMEAQVEKDLDDDLDDDLEEQNEIDDDLFDDDERLFSSLIAERNFSDVTLDERNFSRTSGVWLVLTDQKTLDSLRRMNFGIISSSPLKGLKKVLVEVVEPDDKDLSDVRNLLYSVLPDADLVVDYNHIYTYEPEYIGKQSSKNDIKEVLSPHRQPRVLLPLPKLEKNRIKIGIIDSQVDHNHEALQNSKITTKSFIKSRTDLPTEHGTAVASIISGHSDSYFGLLPKMDLYAASVFYQEARLGQTAMVTSLILSLDWMAQVGADIINMSLSGPKNEILEATLKQLHEQDILVVAAAGNNGPVGPPLYPAAYDFTIAVTAVGDKNLAYTVANRGSHIDLAAPGVDIQHAADKNSYSLSSGTSLAAPFVTAITAWALAEHESPPGTSHDTAAIIETIYRSAKDLGDPGHDEVYGHGLVQPLESSMSRQR